MLPLRLMCDLCDVICFRWPAIATGVRQVGGQAQARCTAHTGHQGFTPAGGAARLHVRPHVCLVPFARAPCKALTMRSLACTLPRRSLACTATCAGMHGRTGTPVECCEICCLQQAAARYSPVKPWSLLNRLPTHVILVRVACGSYIPSHVNMHGCCTNPKPRRPQKTPQPCIPVSLACQLSDGCLPINIIFHNTKCPSRCIPSRHCYTISFVDCCHSIACRFQTAAAVGVKRLRMTPKASQSHCPLPSRDVDASNVEALLWTATRLGIERLVAGLASYLTSPDVIACAPCQVGP